MFVLAIIAVIGVFVVMIILGVFICASYPTIRDQPRDLLGNPIAYHKLPGYDHHKCARIAKELRKQQSTKDK